MERDVVVLRGDARASTLLWWVGQVGGGEGQCGKGASEVGGAAAALPLDPIVCALRPAGARMHPTQTDVGCHAATWSEGAE